jgi:hypothetical protein
MSTRSATPTRDGQVHRADGRTGRQPAGGSITQVKTRIKAGGVMLNHNETLVRAQQPATSLQVKTRLKAGGLSINHNETLEQVPRSLRRNALPVERINRSLLMGHEHVACALIELLEVGKTPSGTDGVLHHPPEACVGVEVLSAVGRQEMEAPLAVRVVKGCVQLVRPMATAPLDAHHDLSVGFAKGRHLLLEILAQPLSIQVGHHFLEDFGGARLDRPNHPEQHATGETGPRAIASPRLAFERFVAFALTLAQRARGETSALRGAPPARAGQGQAPEDGFIFIEQNEFTPAGPVLEGGKFERALGESSRGGIKAPGGPLGANRFFFNTPRTLSRPSWMPVCCAKTVASARPLHGEWREPCCRGSGSTRRLRCCSRAPVPCGGRPERGRSTQPCTPGLAKR